VQRGDKKMRAKRIGTIGENMTYGNIYNILKEDENNYYVLNDACELIPYNKLDFSLISAYAVLKCNIALDMPNDTKLHLSSGSHYPIIGQIVDNEDFMYVIKLHEKTPIAVSKKVISIIEG
jgi:hypothetical protein